MKKRISRIFAATLAAVFLVLMFPFSMSAVNLMVTTTPAEGEEDYEYA